MRLYYKNPKFALIDLIFGLIGLFSNPYRACRKFLEKKKEPNVHAYGETPYTTYAKIAKECDLGPEDVWLELGSGRGRGCFWLRLFIGCQVIGVEQVPIFVKWSQRIQRFFKVKGVCFERKDIKNIDLRRATVVYMYGIEREVPEGIKIITTGEPLEGARVLKRFWVRFPWGRTAAFLCKA